MWEAEVIYCLTFFPYKLLNESVFRTVAKLYVSASAVNITNLVKYNIEVLAIRRPLKLLYNTSQHSHSHGYWNMPLSWKKNTTNNLEHATVLSSPLFNHKPNYRNRKRLIDNFFAHNFFPLKYVFPTAGMYAWLWSKN